MATTPEGRIKRKLDTMLKQEKVWYYSPQAGPFGHAGIPDRVAIVCGRFVGIECKADAKKPLRPLQVVTRDAICAAGGVWFRVHDDDTVASVRQFIAEARAHARR